MATAFFRLLRNWFGRLRKLASIGFVFVRLIEVVIQAEDQVEHVIDREVFTQRCWVRHRGYQALW